MKTILHELSSSYPINDQIVLPPNEINISNMESYVGKPKYLKDRYVRKLFLDHVLFSEISYNVLELNIDFYGNVFFRRTLITPVMRLTETKMPMKV